MPRKLVYYVACTIDGFIAREDGSFDFFLFEGEHFRDLVDWFPETFAGPWRSILGASPVARQFDTVLMGRKTYEVGLREGVSSPYAPLRQFVVSRTMEESPDPEVVLERGSPVDLVRRLKAEEGKDIWLCGGAKLAAAVFSEIDELVLKINPVLIGAGVPLFDGVSGRVTTSLLEHKAYANGFVLARYKLNHREGAAGGIS